MANQYLTSNKYLVKEHIGLFRASNNFDIYIPDTKELILKCRENKLNILVKILRFTGFKTMTPFNLCVTSKENKQVLRITRGFNLFLSKVKVFDENDLFIGLFKQRFLSRGGAFTVYDFNENPIFQLRGRYDGWGFRFSKGETDELGYILKEWTGVINELFTSKDDYIVTISEHVTSDNIARKFIVASAFCVDMVFKE